MPFQVRQFTARSGKELAILVDDGGRPVFWPNVFVSAVYVRPGASVNTTVKVLRSIGMAMVWAASMGRELDADLTSGPFLSLNDAELLADHLRHSASGQNERLNASTLRSATTSRVALLESFRPDHKTLSRKTSGAANPVEVAARIRWVARYVEWHLQRRLGDLDRRAAQSDGLLSLGEAVVARLRSLVPSARGPSDDDLTLEGVPADILKLVDDAIKPGSQKNPFRNPFVQFRNYLYWRLLRDTGARRAEVRFAKVNEISYPMRRFSISVSKTKQRVVPIRPDTAEAFDIFVQEHWSRLPQVARKRGFLFTDTKGNHLSLRSCNRIFEAIRRHVPGVPDFFVPHTVRRSWNDEFSQRIDAMATEHRLSEKEEIEIRNRLQGWTRQSSMGVRYAKRHIRRKADEIAEKLGSSLLNVSDTDNDCKRWLVTAVFGLV
jgi:integrase